MTTVLSAPLSNKKKNAVAIDTTSSACCTYVARSTKTHDFFSEGRSHSDKKKKNATTIYRTQKNNKKNNAYKIRRNFDHRTLPCDQHFARYAWPWKRQPQTVIIVRRPLRLINGSWLSSASATTKKKNTRTHIHTTACRAPGIFGGADCKRRPALNTNSW